MDWSMDVATPGAPLVERLPAALVVAAGTPQLGTTTTAGLIALAAYDTGASVLLVDAAGDWARAHGVSPVARLFGAGAAVPPLTHLPLADHFALWSGGADARALADDARARVLAHAGAHDVVVFDAGRQWATMRWVGDVMTALALGPAAHAPAALILTGEARESIAASYAAAKVLRQHAGAAGGAAHRPLPVAVTTARLERDRGTSASRTLADACEALLGADVRVLTGLPDDPILPRAIGGGMSIADSTYGSPTRTTAAHLARALLPLRPADALR